jgi:hypothetical protein
VKRLKGLEPSTFCMAITPWERACDESERKCQGRELRPAGVLTQAEFEAKKTDLLGRI